MPAKKKPAAKKEEVEDESSSSSSDSSSEEEAAKAAPKKKVSAKGKAKAEAAAPKEEEAEAAPPPKAKAKAAAAKAEESSSSSDSDSESEDEKADKDKGTEKAPVEEKKFEPPPRPVFTPHDKMEDITGPQELVYCPTCGLPPDFCQFGPTWDKCKPWCMENVPHYYPELCSVSLEDAKKKAEAASGVKQKMKPGGKAVREASPGIQIKRMSRGGRKCVTSVAGMELFGVKLDDAAKKFKKKFSCGASVVKGECGLPDTVDIQGEFEEEVTGILVDEFNVPRAKVTFVDGGTKKKGKGPGGR